MHCGVLVVLLHCRTPCLRALPSRKHLGCAYLRLKIAVSLETSSKDRRFMLTCDLKNRSLCLQSSLARGVCLRTGRAWIYENCAPVRDVLTIPFLANSNIALFRFDHLYIFKNRAPVRSILEILSICLHPNRRKLRDPVRSMRRTWIIMNDHVEGFHFNSISNQSHFTSFQVAFRVARRGVF